MIEDERYTRQTRLVEVGTEGQRRLLESAVLVAGCGALGSHLANTLTRAGIGRLRIVDRDVLELNNLQRQVLFDEDDVAASLPKAEAATRRLRRINSSVAIEALVCDLGPRNIERLVSDVDLVVDGTDNLETRYLINDACVKVGKPWIYGGVIGTSGMSMVIVPGSGPCLRCLFPDPPPPGTLPTCETTGILGTLPATIAAIEATQALRVLLGTPSAGRLISVNLWQLSFQEVAVQRDESCPTCAARRFDFLAARETAWVTVLCGRDAIQIAPAREAHLSLETLSQSLASLGSVSFNGLLLRFIPAGGEHELILFPDGRAMIRGTTDEAVARTLYARYVGS